MDEQECPSRPTMMPPRNALMQSASSVELASLITRDIPRTPCLRALIDTLPRSLMPTLSYSARRVSLPVSCLAMMELLSQQVQETLGQVVMMLMPPATTSTSLHNELQSLFLSPGLSLIVLSLTLCSATPNCYPMSGWSLLH